MICLYVIKSLSNNDLYVGISKDVAKRLEQHNKGSNRYTKGCRPWNLVFSETYPDWASAREKEKYYKSGSGKEQLKIIIESLRK